MPYDDLTDTQFEEFCFELMQELGFVNVDWRKGTGLNASPAEGGLKQSTHHRCSEGQRRPLPEFSSHGSYADGGRARGRWRPGRPGGMCRGPRPWGGIAAAAGWCSRWCRAATGFAACKDTPPRVGGRGTVVVPATVASDLAGDSRRRSAQPPGQLPGGLPSSDAARYPFALVAGQMAL